MKQVYPVFIAEYKKDSTVNVIEISLINNVLWGRTTSGWIILNRE